jgi:hypothetical protein
VSELTVTLHDLELARAMPSAIIIKSLPCFMLLMI